MEYVAHVRPSNMLVHGIYSLCTSNAAHARPWNMPSMYVQCHPWNMLPMYVQCHPRKSMEYAAHVRLICKRMCKLLECLAWSNISGLLITRPTFCHYNPDLLYDIFNDNKVLSYLMEYATYVRPWNMQPM